MFYIFIAIYFITGNYIYVQLDDVCMFILYLAFLLSPFIYFSVDCLHACPKWLSNHVTHLLKNPSITLQDKVWISGPDIHSFFSHAIHIKCLLVPRAMEHQGYSKIPAMKTPTFRRNWCFVLVHNYGSTPIPFASLPVLCASAMLYLSFFWSAFLLGTSLPGSLPTWHPKWLMPNTVSP